MMSLSDGLWNAGDRRITEGIIKSWSGCLGERGEDVGGYSDALY